MKVVVVLSNNCGITHITIDASPEQYTKALECFDKFEATNVVRLGDNIFRKIKVIAIYKPLE